MTGTVRPIPQGFHTVTPSLTVRGAAEAIEYYKKALGAKELMRMPSPDGKIMHAELQIGDSIIFLTDEFPERGMSRAPQSLGGTTGTLNLYVEDVDTSFTRAIDAGGKVNMPVADMFWGDRYGVFTDPFGHQWGIATHKEELSPTEMDKRANDFFAQMAQQAQRKTA
ncbi:MAG TPA: VOC family protein [Terriglobales bacterium]|nr:VOC family protein [Terriglobales bacterium]